VSKKEHLVVYRLSPSRPDSEHHLSLEHEGVQIPLPELAGACVKIRTVTFASLVDW